MRLLLVEYPNAEGAFPTLILLVHCVPRDFRRPFNIGIIPASTTLHVGNIFLFNDTLLDALLGKHDGHQVLGLALFQLCLKGQERSRLEALGTKASELLFPVFGSFFPLHLMPLMWCHPIGDISHVDILVVVR